MATSSRPGPPAQQRGGGRCRGRARARPPTAQPQASQASIRPPDAAPSKARRTDVGHPTFGDQRHQCSLPVPAAGTAEPTVRHEERGHGYVYRLYGTGRITVSDQCVTLDGSLSRSCPSTREDPVVATPGSAANVTVFRIIIVVSVVSTGAVLLGGSAAWLLERNIPGRTLQSWGDGLWWALTTLTTTGYGDQVPVTLAGRAVAAVVMIIGVAIIGGVAAGIALVSARAVAVAEERALEEEAES